MLAGHSDSFLVDAQATLMRTLQAASLTCSRPSSSGVQRVFSGMALGGVLECPTQILGRYVHDLKLQASLLLH